MGKGDREGVAGGGKPVRWREVRGGQEMRKRELGGQCVLWTTESLLEFGAMEFPLYLTRFGHHS